jgi:putative acetyltransferase
MFQITRVPNDHSDLLALVALLDADLAVRYGALQTQYSPFNTLTSVDGAVVCSRNGLAVCCGCWRRYNAASAEIKRMFVRSEYRGTGAATTVLAELEKWIAEASHSRAILETGIKNPEAIRFYTKSGYERTENYGQYAGMENSICMEKRLA